MRNATRRLKQLSLCIALLSVSACGNNFEDFNAWYGSAAYAGHSEAEMDAVKEEIARLRAQQQRYADIQTVPTQATFQREVQQEERRVIQYRPDDRSDAGYGVSNGPLYPATAARDPRLNQAYQTAQSSQEPPSLWQRIWPSASE